jgi:sugar lactone lactonase YvrE
LIVHDLKREPVTGAIGVRGPADGTAHFSDFRYSVEPPPDPGPMPWSGGPPGVMDRWQVTGPLARELVDSDELPSPEALADMTWRAVAAEPSGLVNLSRVVARTGPLPDAVLARTTITAEQDTIRPLDIGYSDHASVYLNGTKLFEGRSAYRERDPSFLGIVGYHDTVMLPLEEGANELVVKVTEVFGGWGLMARWGDAVHIADPVSRLWSTDATFRIPESVAWDPKREVFYVSNYDGTRRSRDAGLQSISKVSVDGSRIELDWVSGLYNPIGLAVDGDVLWAAESTGLAKIDIAGASVIERYPIPRPGMPNDPAVDGEGTVYLSDMRGSCIYRMGDGGLEVWLEGPEIARPNGLHVLGGELMIGVNGDGTVKAADLDTGELRTVAGLGPGIIDGIASDEHGSLLVSHWEGRVFRIASDGSVTKLLDTTVIEDQSADIAFAPGRGLLAVPQFYGNRVTVYRVAESAAADDGQQKPGGRQ